MISQTLLSALCWATFLTVLIAVIDIQVRASSSIKSALTSNFLLYLLILLFGNLLATGLASVMFAENIPDELRMASPAFFGFAGVFAFEGIITNTNIQFFDKKVLTFQEWIGKARDPAIAAALEKHASFESLQKTKVAEQLKELCSVDLIKTYLHTALDDTALSALNADQVPDLHLHVAIALVEADLNRAKSIVKQKKKIAKLI